MRSLLALSIVLPPAVAGCAGGQPFLLRGDAVSAEIGYSGNITATLPVATLHCAQFERVPELIGKSLDIASYDCRKR